MLINDEKLNKEKVKNMLKPIFDNYGVKKAILFGSVAKGTNTERSDVDIMVDSGLKGIKFFGLLEDVVSVLNKQVDLIDKRQIIKDSLVDREINNTGVLIYG